MSNAKFMITSIFIFFLGMYLTHKKKEMYNSVLKESKYVIFYSKSYTDTITVKTTDYMMEYSQNGCNYITSRGFMLKTTFYYQGTAPFKRIYYKETKIR